MKGMIVGLGFAGFITEATLQQEKPDYIAFLVTEETRALPDKILSRLKYKHVDHKTFFIKYNTDLTEITEEFFNAFYWLIENEKITEIAVEATSTMTPIRASLYISSSFINVFKDLIKKDIKLRLLYTQSKYNYNEEGMRSEVPGTQKVIELDEPVEAIGFIVGLQGIKQFEEHYYLSAYKTFSLLEKVILGERALLYTGLAKLSLAMNAWDNFNIPVAIEEMNNAIINLERIRSYDFAPKIVAMMRDSKDTLEKMKESQSFDTVVDIYENANRRMKSEKYDDAIARYYSCLEALVQYCLAEHGINTSSPDYSKMPKEVVEKFENYCKASDDKGVKSEGLPSELPLKKALVLLSYFDDPVSKKLQQINRKKIMGIIGMRNQSILAHGGTPLNANNAKQFHDELVRNILEAVAEAKNFKLDEMVQKHKHFELPITAKELVRRNRR